MAEILTATNPTILSSNAFAAGKVSKIELLMLISDVIVFLSLKILNSISMEFVKYLNKDAKKKKKDTFCIYSRVGLL